MSKENRGGARRVHVCACQRKSDLKLGEGSGSAQRIFICERGLKGYKTKSLRSNEILGRKGLNTWMPGKRVTEQEIFEGVSRPGKNGGGRGG